MFRILEIEVGASSIYDEISSAYRETEWMVLLKVTGK